MHVLICQKFQIHGNNSFTPPPYTPPQNVPSRMQTHASSISFTFHLFYTLSSSQYYYKDVANGKLTHCFMTLPLQSMKATTKTKRVKMQHNYSYTPLTLQFMALQHSSKPLLKTFIKCLLFAFIWQLLICFSSFSCAYYCFHFLFKWVFCFSLINSFFLMNQIMNQIALISCFHSIVKLQFHFHRDYQKIKD